MAALDEVTWCATLGGDEFAVLIERDADDERLTRVARTALAAVGEPVLLGDNEIAITASVGVVRGLRRGRGGG